MNYLTKPGLKHIHSVPFCCSSRYNSTLVPAVSGLMTSNGNLTNRGHDMRMVVMPTAIHTELASSAWPPIGHGDKTNTESA